MTAPPHSWRHMFQNSGEHFHVALLYPPLLSPLFWANRDLWVWGFNYVKCQTSRWRAALLLRSPFLFLTLPLRSLGTRRGQWPASRQVVALRKQCLKTRLGNEAMRLLPTEQKKGAEGETHPLVKHTSEMVSRELTNQSPGALQPLSLALSLSLTHTHRRPSRHPKYCFFFLFLFPLPFLTPLPL